MIARTFGWLAFFLVFNEMAPPASPPPTPEVDGLAPFIVVLEDPFPCLDPNEHASVRLACARLGCLCHDL